MCEFRDVCRKSLELCRRAIWAGLESDLRDTDGPTLVEVLFHMREKEKAQKWFVGYAADGVTVSSCADFRLESGEFSSHLPIPTCQVISYIICVKGFYYGE